MFTTKMTTPQQKLYQDMTFYELKHVFVIVPKTEPDRMLVINRQTGEITREVSDSSLHKGVHSCKQIKGILGAIQLISTKYLLLITQIAHVGNINGEPIYRVENVDLVPYLPTTLHLSEEQRRYNQQYLQMVNQFLRAPFFYLSYTYDLTHTLQRIYNCEHQFATLSYYERSDKRFVWNKHLLQDFTANPKFASYCLPIIYGFFSINKVTLEKKQFMFALISRRSIDHAGARFFVRGLDQKGNAANFVETEQVVQTGTDLYSFVQVRGSIPLYWSQLPNLTLNPPPTVTSGRQQHHGFIRHINSLLLEYSSIVMVNLINNRGLEEPLLSKLYQLYRNCAQAWSSFFDLESFDFHNNNNNTQTGGFQRLSVLLEKLDRHIESFGFFHHNKSVGHSPQRGCFRTNCIDSLDHTNLVQNLIAKRSLEVQLSLLGIIDVGEQLEDFPTFYHIYRNVWADNSDACSWQYAGTNAFKAEFISTGHRRMTDKVSNVGNALVRFYKNNFKDGFRQDSIDLILGNHVVQSSEGKTSTCPLAKRNYLKIFTEHLTDKLMCFIIWLFTTATMMGVIMCNAEEFIDWPTLVPVEVKR